MMVFAKISLCFLSIFTIYEGAKYIYFTVVEEKKLVAARKIIHQPITWTNLVLISSLSIIFGLIGICSIFMHTNKKKNRYIVITMACLFFLITLADIATISPYSLKSKEDIVAPLSDYFFDMINRNDSMTNSLSYWKLWFQMEVEAHCCGYPSYSMYYNYNFTIPISCCGEVPSSVKQAFSENCDNPYSNGCAYVIVNIFASIAISCKTYLCLIHLLTLLTVTVILKFDKSIGVNE